jgi:hypothetical protein
MWNAQSVYEEDKRKNRRLQKAVLIPVTDFVMDQQTQVGHGLIIGASRLHSDTPHSSVPVINLTQSPLLDNTHYSQEKNILASGGIGTYSPSEQAAADRRLVPRGHPEQNKRVIPIMNNAISI